MWKNTCDCGRCEDCNLERLLAEKGLVAFGKDDFNETSDGWTASDDDWEGLDYPAVNPDYRHPPVTYSAHVEKYQMRMWRIAGDLYWRDKKELWSRASDEDHQIYMDRAIAGER